MRLIKRFFEDINRIANCMAFPRTQDTVVTFSQMDMDRLIEAFTNFRRRRPAVKKEAING